MKWSWFNRVFFAAFVLLLLTAIVFLAWRQNIAAEERAQLITALTQSQTQLREEGIEPEAPEPEQIVQGVVGPAGAQGERGPRGLPGEDGKSVTGPRGPAGKDGVDGESIIGPQGPAGESVIGPQGPVGPKGDTGDAGPAGPSGPAGPTCPADHTATTVWVELTTTPDATPELRQATVCLPTEGATP